MEVLVFNSIIYWATTFYYYKKYGVSLISFLWFYYSLFTIFGILLMVDDLYFRLQEIDPSEEIHMLPYIFVYITFQLITLPLRRINQNSFLYSDRLYQNKFFLKICKSLNLIAILYVIVKVFQVYLVTQIGFGEMHEQEDDTIVYPGMLGSIMRVVNIIGRINNMIIMPIVIYYVLKGYAVKVFKGKFVARMTIPYILGVVLMGFVGGSRGAIFFGIMTLSFYYILFFYSIPRRVHFGIWIPFLLFLLIAYNVSALIAEYRFNIDVNDSILSYLGQMWPNVNYEVWGQSIQHPMGKRLFPQFFGNTGYSSEDWFYQTNIKGWLFVTVWGTFYCEFGVFFSMLFFCFLFFLINSFVKKRLLIIEVGVLSYVYFFCFSSLFGLSFTTPDYYGLFLSLFLIWYLKHSVIGKKIFY